MSRKSSSIMASAQRSPFIIGCFLLSGAAGLIYEVVWSRQLMLLVGMTTYAHTAVITSYMLGLALGSYFIGRHSDRHPAPLRLFGWLEIAIALYAAATPWLSDWLQFAYAHTAHFFGITGLPSHLLRFLLALLLLLPPTFLMGGTLPVMIRAMTGHLPELARISGRFYGINTLGAVLGTLAAGYLLIPRMGMHQTLMVGVTLDLVVGIMMLALSRRFRFHDTVATVTARGESRTTPCDEKRWPWAPVWFAVSGFAALTYQIAWIRSLTLVLGSSVYSFSAVLATFLSGIALGSLSYTIIPGGRSQRGRYGQAAVITLLTGLSALAGLGLMGRLPEIYLWGFRQSWSASFPVFQGFTFSIAFMIMFLPTFFLGILFPLMAALWTRDHSTLGREVGMIYAANTIGCIAGSMLAGLMFLPVLGVNGTIILAAGLHVLVSIAFMWSPAFSVTKHVWRLGASLGILALYAAMAWMVPPWDKAVMTTGVFNYADSLSGSTLRQAVQHRADAFSMLYYKDGLDGTINVVERDGQRMLVINGKIDASTRSDLPTQVFLGHVPTLVHSRPLSVLIIGLGSGISAGAMALDSAIERIDIVEISPEVVEASSFFSESNHRVLEDPRVNIIVADARNFLLATDRKYDIIMTQPSNPWLSGVANLFTLEFFRLMKSRLAPDGVVVQWLQIYNMSPLDTRSVMSSFQHVFPSITTWLTQNSDMIMVGSDRPRELDARQVQAKLDQPNMLAQLRAINANNLEQITKMFLIDDASLAAFCSDAPLNTDDRPRIEFNAPKYLYQQTTEGTLRDMVRHLEHHPARLAITNLVEVRGPQLRIPLLDLTIIAHHDLQPDQWSEEVRVWRILYPVGDGKPDILGVGSQIWIRWTDHHQPNELKIFQSESEPTMNELQTYLRAYQSHPLIAGGEVDLPGGFRGPWILAQLPQDNQMTLFMTWSAPSRYGGYRQFVAERTLTNPGPDEWGNALIAFAKSFRSGPVQSENDE